VCVCGWFKSERVLVLLILESDPDQAAKAKAVCPGPVGIVRGHTESHCLESAGSEEEGRKAIGVRTKEC